MAPVSNSDSLKSSNTAANCTPEAPGGLQLICDEETLMQYTNRATKDLPDNLKVLRQEVECFLGREVPDTAPLFDKTHSADNTAPPSPVQTITICEEQTLGYRDEEVKTCTISIDGTYMQITKECPSWLGEHDNMHRELNVLVSEDLDGCYYYGTDLWDCGVNYEISKKDNPGPEASGIIYRTNSPQDDVLPPDYEASFSQSLAMSCAFAKHVEAKTGTRPTQFLPVALNKEQVAYVKFEDGYLTIVTRRPDTQVGGSVIIDNNDGTPSDSTRAS